ncbi:MAG TPA: hypothetical protein VGC68_01415, partial [Enterovirga sp.]
VIPGRGSAQDALLLPSLDSELVSGSLLHLAIGRSRPQDLLLGEKGPLLRKRRDAGRAARASVASE